MVELKNLLPFSNRTKRQDDDDINQDVTLGKIAITDSNGRTLGLEDQNDPRFQDDPKIFTKNAITSSSNTNPTTINYPPLPPNFQPSKQLLPSTGKPFIDPKLYGGSNLDLSSGKGEPLNIILSALSSPDILTKRGCQNYLRSLDFDYECLGLHSGGPQQAFLDPRGWVDQNFLYRQVYTPFDYIFGTCVESLLGGNHVRSWQQQGTGAWFFAVSREKNVTDHHDIVPNGYDLGRDEFLQQSQKNKNGITSFMFKTYQTKFEYVTGLYEPGSAGINHDIATDGRTVLITVTLLNYDQKALIKAQNKAIQQQQKVSISGSPAAATPSTPNQKKNKRISLLSAISKKDRQTQIAAS